MLGTQSPPSASQQLSDSFQRERVLARRDAGEEASGASLVPTNDLYKNMGTGRASSIVTPGPLKLQVTPLIFNRAKNHSSGPPTSTSITPSSM